MERDALLSYADAVIHVITALGLDSMVAAACPATWGQAGRCLRSSEPAEQLLGYRLVLAALAETPDGPRLLVEGLQAALAGQP